MREAAALPLVTLTAWEGLVDKAAVKAGDRVLVHGGAGGVGHVAVQLAKVFGADVYATVSPAKQSIIESYGATSIDYQSVGVNEYVAQHTNGDGFDIIYDTVGGESLDLSFQAIRPYGHVVSCAAFSSHNLAPGSLRCMTLSGVFVTVWIKSAQRAICAWSRPGVFLNSQYRSPLGLRWLDEGHLRLGRWLAPEMIPGR